MSHSTGCEYYQEILAIFSWLGLMVKIEQLPNENEGLVSYILENSVQYVP